jgi:hypothetical protein
VAVAAVLYVASGLLGVRGTPALQDEIVGGAVPFTLGHSDALRRVDPEPGEALRLEGRPGGPEQSYAAEPFEIPAHRGDVTAVLGVLAARQADALARELPDFRYRGDGKARINELPGTCSSSSSAGTAGPCTASASCSRRSRSPAPRRPPRHGRDAPGRALPRGAQRGRRRRRQRPQGAAALLPLRDGPAVAMSEPDRTLTWAQFEAVDMRVGRITEVLDFPEARRPAWRLRLDFGPELGERRSSAQITNYPGRSSSAGSSWRW